VSTVQIPSKGKQLSASKASPFLKWAGGKARLLAQFEKLFPESWKAYHEPFLGGGAVFFRLTATGRVQQGSLSDINEGLVECYEMVRDQVDDVIEALREHEEAHSDDYYYQVRGISSESLDAPQRAARMIYLNKTCYNGLYRVNSRGKFNVPVGSYVNPTVCDEANLRSASKALENTDICVASFSTVVDRAEEGDFVYLDPPYVPVSKTANFTSYSKGGFTEEDQKNLAATFAELHDKGCKVMLSNSDSPLVRALYSDSRWRIEEVFARRNINSKGTKRGSITELVVLSY